MGVLRRDDHLQRLSTAAAFTIMVLFTAAAAFTTLTPPLTGTVTVVQHLGPGSSPPLCKSKCGHCSPCKAVHVAIHLGISVPLEYYPEAWRCKCGKKLFLP